MLQWMGGSRRKVTTSQKSIQKRQKQYFEQRRRQQIAGFENSDATGNKWEEETHKKEHKSLDILNLLNFSTSSHDDKYYSPHRREEQKGNAPAVNYPNSMDAPIHQASRVIPADSVEIEKQGTLSDCRLEILSPKKILPCSLENVSNLSDEDDKTPDLCDVETQQKLSVFDLLGDGESNEYLDEGQTHEAHVAFSVNGVGKVETETPPQSPQKPNRHIYSCFSPLKAETELSPSRNCYSVLSDIEHEVDAIMQDLEMPPSRISSDSYSNHEKNKFLLRDHVQFDGPGNKVRSPYSHGRSFTGIDNNFEDLWSDRSDLPDDFLDEWQYDTSWKSLSCHFDGYSTEFLKRGIPNYALEDLQLPKRWDAKKAYDRFKSSGSPAMTHQKSENDYDFMISSGARQHSAARNMSYTDVALPNEWSSFVLEHSRKSPSLLSEG